MTPAVLQRWRRVHTWSSLFCTAFLFVLCATGLPLVFRDELDALLAPQPEVSEPERGEALALDRLIERARARHPGRFVDFVFWGEAHVLGLGLSAARGSGLDGVTREYVDDRTGMPLASEPAEGGFTDTLAELHRDLCVGTAGDLLLGLVALAFMSSLASGVVVYAPLLRRVGFGVLRAQRRRVLQLDLHNLAGMVCLLWALLVGATGFVNTLEAPLFAAWDSDTLERLLEPHRGKPPIVVRSSVDAALATARAALPGMRPTSVGFPESAFASPRHYLIWMRGESLFTSRMFTPVLVDAESGALASARAFPWYLSALELSRPLHFGDFGGLSLKLFWALMDGLLLLVLATGLYLWMRRVRAA